MLTEKLAKSARWIALIRTLAPLIWAALITWFSDSTIDLSAHLADWLNVPEPFIQRTGPLVIAFALWLIAVLAPSDLIEKVILLIKVENQSYSVGENVITNQEKIPNRNILILPDGSDEETAQAATDAILRRLPDRGVVSDAAKRLIEYTDR